MAYVPGTTSQVGAGFGAVFKINTNRVLTSLYLFTGGNDGSHPNALVQGSGGSFYGTTEDGNFHAGNIFRIVMPPPPPTLTIAQDGNQVMLSWPTNAAGFVLEAADSLSSPTAWSTNSDTPIIIGYQNTITVSNPVGSKFYRLQK